MDHGVPMIRYCEHPVCSTLVVATRGTRRTRTCTAHAGKRPPEESDAEIAERTRKAMGWAKPRAR